MNSTSSPRSRHGAVFFRNGSSPSRGIIVDLDRFRRSGLKELIRELETVFHSKVRKIYSCHKDEQVRSIREIEPGYMYAYTKHRGEPYSPPNVQKQKTTTASPARTRHIDREVPVTTSTKSSDFNKHRGKGKKHSLMSDKRFKNLSIPGISPERQHRLSSGNSSTHGTSNSKPTTRLMERALSPHSIIPPIKTIACSPTKSIQGDVFPRLQDSNEASAESTIVPEQAEQSSVDAGDVIYHWLRTPVPSSTRSWTVSWPDYKPLIFTADSAKATDSHKISGARPQEFTIRDTSNDASSYGGKYFVDKRGLPCRPLGRSGVRGRGILKYFGPNHAADPIVTRWKVNEDSGKLERDKNGGRMLEILLVRRPDSFVWSLPGGMVEAGEIVSPIVKHCLGATAVLRLSRSNIEKRAIADALQHLFDTSTEIYRGATNDPRDTDNAWVESCVYNFHDENGSATAHFPLAAGNEAWQPAWITLSPHLRIDQNHLPFIKRVRDLLLGGPSVSNNREKAAKKARNHARWLHKLRVCQFIDKLSHAQKKESAEHPIQILDEMFVLALDEASFLQLEKCMAYTLLEQNKLQQIFGFLISHESDFAKFRSFFLPVMAIMHFTTERLHRSVHRVPPSRSSLLLSTESDIQIALRMSRNLPKYPMLLEMTEGDFRSLEAVSREACEAMGVKCGLNGMYYSLTPGHPCSASAEILNGLRTHGIFLPDRGTHSHSATSCLARYWPIGRGFYVNKSYSVVVLVGFDDHIQIAVRDKALTASPIYEKCTEFMDELESALLRQGHLKLSRLASVAWKVDPDIGFVSTFPSRCGTGMNVAVQFTSSESQEWGKFDYVSFAKQNKIHIWTNLAPNQKCIILELATSVGGSDIENLEILCDGVQNFQNEVKTKCAINLNKADQMQIPLWVEESSYILLSVPARKPDCVGQEKAYFIRLLADKFCTAALHNGIKESRAKLYEHKRKCLKTAPTSPVVKERSASQSKRTSQIRGHFQNSPRETNWNLDALSNISHRDVANMKDKINNEYVAIREGNVAESRSGKGMSKKEKLKKTLQQKRMRTIHESPHLDIEAKEQSIDELQVQSQVQAQEIKRTSSQRKRSKLGQAINKPACGSAVRDGQVVQRMPSVDDIIKNKSAATNESARSNTKANSGSRWNLHGLSKRKYSSNEEMIAQINKEYQNSRKL